MLDALPDQPLVKSLNRLVDVFLSVTENPIVSKVCSHVRDEVHTMADYVKSATPSDKLKMKQAIEEHADKYSEILSQQVMVSEQALLKQATLFKEVTKEKINEAHRNWELKQGDQLAEQLAAQNTQFQETLAKGLATQAEDMERYYSPKVKARGDKKRAGQLTMLDHLALKLQHTEKYCAECWRSGNMMLLPFALP